MIAPLLAVLAAGPTVTFELRLLDPAERRVQVHAVFRGLDPARERLSLSFPEGATYVKLPEPLLDGPVRASSGARELAVEREAPYAWTVAKGGASELELDYTVALTHRDVPEVAERDAYEHPYVSADHGMLTCGTLFLAPDMDLEAVVRFALPEGWPVRTSWTERAPFEFGPLATGDLRDGLIAVGNWKAHSLEVGGARVETLFAPTELELEAVAAPLVEGIARAELELFGVRPFERFLLVFTPSDVRGLAGSAKQGGLVLSVRHGLPANVLRAQVAHLVAHEFFHTWATSRYHAPDELRFVNEGFTDYFANHVASRIGAATWDEFAAALADNIRRYENGARATKLSLVEAGGPAFFSSREAYDQIYCGGLLVAAMCELAMRAREPRQDLDAFLRELNNDPRWSRGGAAPKLADFLELLERRAGPELAAHVRSLFARTDVIDFAAELTRLGCKVDRTTQRASLDLRANLDGTRLRDLDPMSALHTLGLRPGDVVLAVGDARPANPSETYAAFRALRGDRVRLELRRGESELVIDEPVPSESTLAVDAAPWRR